MNKLENRSILETNTVVFYSS